MELHFTYALIVVIAGYFAVQVVSRRFDPFAPPWMFLVGFVQVYVVQAISYHEWAIGVRGEDLVAAANWRALWACALFLSVYHLGPGRLFARCLPTPPSGWSPKIVLMVAPVLVLWGLICGGLVLRGGGNVGGELSPEQMILLAFPFVMLLGAIMLIVTGRSGGVRRPLLLYGGLACAAAYVMLWMFNGKRSHSLMGILSAVCAFYVSKGKRPSWPVLIATGCAGVLAVALALGWRFYANDSNKNLAGFVEFLVNFDPSFALECFNIDTNSEGKPQVTRETEEYGGFLLMMDTVPEKSEYDYGAPYLRIFSTYIPRFLWHDKPLFGREQWVNAWIAGSELKRSTSFTGPAISILGATQLNGGALGTAIVMSSFALLLRTAYEFFRRHGDRPWVQCWWAVSYFNAWFMVVNDDPLIWFYYNWGFTTLPPLLFMWFLNRAPAHRHAVSPAFSVAGYP